MSEPETPAEAVVDATMVWRVRKAPDNAIYG